MLLSLMFKLNMVNENISKILQILFSRKNKDIIEKGPHCIYIILITDEYSKIVLQDHLQILFQ